MAQQVAKITWRTVRLLGVAALAFIAGIWTKQPPHLDTKDTIEVIKIVLAAIGGAYGLWKYMDTAEQQFRRPFWERCLSLYAEASEMAARIAVVSQSEERDKAIQRFEELFHGAMCMVEDRDVEAKMVSFKQALDRNEGDLEVLAHELAWACRKSVGESWQVKLEELRKDRHHASG